MKMPDALSFWTVDEVIECLSTDAATSRNLLALAPDTYGPPSLNIYGDEDYPEYPPEPDAKAGVYLEKIWDDLDNSSKAHLISMAKKEC